MMKIEEAIEHAEQAYKENRNGSLYARKRGENSCAARLRKCAEEHRQLAEWLKELKERRELPEVILCKDCDNLKSDEYHHWCKSHGGFFNPEKDFCSRAVRR